MGGPGPSLQSGGSAARHEFGELEAKQGIVIIAYVWHVIHTLSLTFTSLSCTRLAVVDLQKVDSDAKFMVRRWPACRFQGRPVA